MIKSKKELKFFIMTDNMMNRGRFHNSLPQRIKDFINPDKTMAYLRLMRKVDYYTKIKSPLSRYYLWRYNRLGVKLGFSIAADVFGYGLVIPHFGTIVVGDKNTIGNYAILHTSICITAGGKVIGDGLLVGTGAKIVSCKQLGNNVSIAANSVVSKSFSDNNILLVGMPAYIKGPKEAWYVLAGKHIEDRISKCERLKQEMGIGEIHYNKQ